MEAGNRVRPDALGLVCALHITLGVHAAPRPRPALLPPHPCPHLPSQDPAPPPPPRPAQIPMTLALSGGVGLHHDPAIRNVPGDGDR